MVEAERSGEQRALAAAMSVLDSCLVELGRPDEATHMAKALELYEELGDQLYVAITLGNLGGVSFFESKWEQAADYYVRAVDASNQAGDLAGAAIAHAQPGRAPREPGPRRRSRGAPRFRRCARSSRSTISLPPRPRRCTWVGRERFSGATTKASS